MRNRKAYGFVVLGIARWIVQRAVLLAVAALLGSVSAANAATITVASTADPAVANAANCPGAGCTLRDALAKASDGDTIVFSVGSNQTITLTSNVSLTVGTSVTIDGAGSPGLTIDGNSTVTVLIVSATGTSTISNLEITHGAASYSIPYPDSTCGGAIALPGNGAQPVVALPASASRYFLMYK